MRQKDKSKSKKDEILRMPEHTIEYLYGRLVDIDAWFDDPSLFTEEYIKKRVRESLDVMNKCHDKLSEECNVAENIAQRKAWKVV